MAASENHTAAARPYDDPSNPVSFSAAAAGPTLSSVTPSSGSASGGTTVTLVGTGLTGATSVKFGANPATSFTVNSATQITAVTPAGTPGVVPVTVTTTAGTSNPVAFTYVTAGPTLSSVTPSSGSVSGGTTVTLVGTGLTGATSVKFGANPATSFTVNSATQITAVTPAGTPGVVPVTVTTTAGTSNPVAFTYQNSPVVTALSPSNGPTSGGSTVTITGADLTAVTSVKFGETPAASFTVDSATQITAVSPAGTAGGVPVTVTTAAGTSSAGSASAYFFYANPPQLADIAPTAGPAAGGTAVTLTGADLLNATAVLFGGVSSPSFTVESSTRITATAPPGTGYRPVTVVTPGGTSNSMLYAYVSPPTLTGVSPASGTTDAGAQVTLSGTNLSRTTKVSFGAALASFKIISETTLSAVAPAGAAGNVPVTVTTPGGVSNSVTYTRVAPPGI
ncbi:IPT/TIG domain-containing protein [Streptomyces oryzae]|uniref:IPT/TIG domain-containing protein n=1 Tax=Streptomyces oryzae TaxID=1434886 RepID=UPI0027DC4319|nr:IPT/TIG domain-containing protein [Streptomyces oryzae]